MHQAVFLGILGLGVAGATSLCDLCTPSAAGAVSTRSTDAAPRVPAAPMRVTAGRVVPVLPVVAQPKTVRFKVAGMTCGGCVVGTRTVLTRLPGVTKAEVSYEKGDAVVTYDPDRVTVAQMVAAVKTLGYTATPVAG